MGPFPNCAYFGEENDLKFSFRVGSGVDCVAGWCSQGLWSPSPAPQLGGTPRAPSPRPPPVLWGCCRPMAPWCGRGTLGVGAGAGAVSPVNGGVGRAGPFVLCVSDVCKRGDGFWAVPWPPLSLQQCHCFQPCDARGPGGTASSCAPASAWIFAWGRTAARF